MHYRTGWMVGGMAAVFALVIGTLQWYKWQTFGYNALDLGIYAQTIWSLSQGRGFANSIHDPNYLGDHVELWLAPVAALYRIWSHPLTILWVQTLVLAISVWPVWWIARRYLNLKLAYLAAGLWLAHPLLYNAAMYEFHGLAFALPILLWSIVAYIQRRLGWWLVLMVLLVLVREDMPLIVLGWGLLAALDRRSWRWWAPAALLGAAWFVFAQSLIGHFQPAGSYKYLAYYPWLGDSFGEIATFPFRHPVIFAQHLFHIRNWLTALSFLLTFGFLPLLRPKLLIPVGLAFFQLALGGAWVDSVLRIHYVIPYLPFLAWATLAGLKDVRAGRQLVRWPPMLVAIVAVTSPLYAHIVFGPAEQPFRPWDPVTRTSTPLLDWSLTQVAPTDRVMTTFNLLPALANREHLYSLSYVHLGKRQLSDVPYTLPTPLDRVVIDWQQYYDYQFLYRMTDVDGVNGTQRLATILDQNNLQLESWVDNVAIYSRIGTNAYQPTELIGVQELTEGDLTVAEPPTINMIAAEPAAGVDRQVEVAILWDNYKNREEPLSITFEARRQDALVWSSTRILGQGVFPAEAWQAGQRWLTRYHLAIPQALGDNLTLSAVVEELSGRLKSDALRRYTPLINDRQRVVETVVGTIPAGTSPQVLR